MDDLKLYGKSERELDNLVQTVRIFSEDINMTFGLGKCAKTVLKRGKLSTPTEEIIVPEGTIKNLEIGDAYKYLGIEENADLDHSRMKEKIKKEYLKRVRKLLSTKLYSGSKIRAINTYAVPVIRYSAGIVEWTKIEQQNLDRKTRKLLTLNGALHPRSDVDRLYIPRDEGGRGLTSIEDMVEQEKLTLRDYIERKKDKLIEAVQQSGEHKRKMATEATAAEYKKVKHQERYNGWKEKTLHGHFLRTLPQEADPVQTFRWLTKGNLNPSTEAILVAAQDQALNTKAHAKNILKCTRDGQCRLCGQHEETVSHLVAGCPILANAKYKERHNEVAKIVHWSLCKKYNIETIQQWWKHQPEAVAENDAVKILWDFSIRTDNKIQANKPDLVVVDKANKTLLIIDIACPLDINIGKKEQDKILKYQELKTELQRLWKLKGKVIPVVIGALGAVTKNHSKYVQSIHDTIKTEDLQKATLLGTSKILREVLSLPDSR